MDFNLKALAARVAVDGSAEAAKTAAGRIDHWASMGMFDVAGVDIGPKTLGRGRVRRYPEGALRWCLLWSALADRGLGVVAMVITTQKIQISLVEKGQEAKWLRQAMRGEGPALFLFDESAGQHELGAGRGITAYRIKLSRSPIKLPDDWAGGFFLNLTAVFERAAND